MKHRIRILFLIPTLGAGGAERVVTTLVKHLDRSKFSINLAVLDLREAFFLDEIPSDVKLLNLNVRRVRYSFVSILRLARSMQPDIVFSTLDHLNFAFGLMRALLPRRSVIIARGASITSEILQRHTFYRFMLWGYGLAYRRFDNFVAQSRAMRDDLCYNFGISPERVVIIPNPLDREAIEEKMREQIDDIRVWKEKPPERIVRVLAVGRLSEEKGYDILIEALALCKQNELRVVVIGEGPLRRPLEALARSRGVGSQIEFVGVRKNPYAHMAKADLFVMTSRYEGFPNSVLEALACGTLVIATPAKGGLSDIIETTPGIRLTRSCSATELASELVRFAITRGEALPSPVLDCYDAERIVAEYESFFISTLFAHKSTRTARSA